PDGRLFDVSIARAHMEEDAGKLTHVGGATGRNQGAEHPLGDYDRCQEPLLDIAPHLISWAERHSPVLAEAYVSPIHHNLITPALANAYVSAIRDIVISLGISEAKMERGNLRCDANISLRSRAAVAEAQTAGLPLPLGTRTETKNVNSLRSVERAIRYEIQRQ